MVKTRLQASSSGYKGPIECFRSIISTEGGPRALYRGLAANLIGVAPEKSIKLVIPVFIQPTQNRHNIFSFHQNQAANEYFREMLEEEDGSISLLNEVISGAGAGTCQVNNQLPLF